MLTPDERLKELGKQHPDLKVVQLPRKDGTPSNTSVVVDSRSGEMLGAVIVRGGGKMDCSKEHYEFVVGRMAT